MKGNNDLDALIEAAELGEEARAFMGSNLCRKMLDMADSAVHDALLALAEVDPADRDRIQALQADVRFGQSFAQRLLDLVADGEQAINIYRQQEAA